MGIAFTWHVVILQFTSIKFFTIPRIQFLTSNTKSVELEHRTAWRTNCDIMTSLYLFQYINIDIIFSMYMEQQKSTLGIHKTIWHCFSFMKSCKYIFYGFSAEKWEDLEKALRQLKKCHTFFILWIAYELWNCEPQTTFYNKIELIDVWRLSIIEQCTVIYRWCQ